MSKADNSQLAQPVNPCTMAILGDSRSRALARAPLLWLNLVCLDAPLVAICWQWIFAYSFHIAIPAGNRAALFLSGGLIYLADRIGDAISLRPSQPKSIRQQFCLAHRKLWLGSILCVGVVDAIVILKWVDYETIRAGAFLGAITLVYVMLNHTHSELWKIVPLKEFSIGSLFAAGTLLGVTPYIGAQRTIMMLAAIFFAALCFLNCVSIAMWERDLDRTQGKHSLATLWPDANIPRALLPVLLAGCALLLVFDVQIWPVALSLGTSGLLLGAIPHMAVSRDERTALADLVLLAPLVLLLLGRIL
jgi:hypothetical protein